MRGKLVSLWRHPKPMLHIWSDTSPKFGGAKTKCGKQFQHKWADTEAKKHINWLKLRAARLALLLLASPGDTVKLHLNNMMVIDFIRKMEEPAYPHYAWNIF